MCSVIKGLIPGIISIAALSCCLPENTDNCGTWLEFIFDYNMEFADSFTGQVPWVDVYIFDAGGIYVLHKHAQREQLTGQKRMYIGNELHEGSYRVVTAGGLCEHFRFTDTEGKGPVAGVTGIEEVELALVRTSNDVSHEFPHLWFGTVTEIEHRNNGSMWPVHLVRNTNHFHVVLLDADGEGSGRGAGDVPYTFGIVTPEGAAYDFRNNPRLKETVVFRPFYLEPGEGSPELAAGGLNTMRLFADHPDGYRLAIYDNTAGNELWGYDLMPLLNNMKPVRPDGTPMPLQEYLDRQAEWNVVVIYRETPSPGPGAVVAVRIIVNGWIIWENDIDV